MDVINRLEAFDTPTRDSLADQVVIILKRFILVEHLEPGARMPPERHLANTLNVSRTVLREALSRLIGEGLLVRTSPRILQLAQFDPEVLATSISPLSDREMRFRDLMELRYILEMGALPVIIKKLTAESLAEIKHWVEEYERRLQSGDVGHGVDVQFHASLLRALDNETIDSLLPLIEEQIREYLLFDPSQLRVGGSAGALRVVREHREIVDAIEARDPIEALGAMERHLSPYFVAIQERDREQVIVVSP